MVFCNSKIVAKKDINTVTILILVDGFLQWWKNENKYRQIKVTILILVDGFLQCGYGRGCFYTEPSHNPYFSRWFSAINQIVL